MRLRALLMALATVVSCGACATGADRSSAPTARGSDTELGSRCITSSGVICILAMRAPVDGACSCDSMYGPQAGKVVP